jgi:hypothetical protein
MIDLSGVTKEELIRAIHRECVGCCGQKEEKIVACDLLTCPFHQFIKYHAVESIDTPQPKKRRGREEDD